MNPIDLEEIREEAARKVAESGVNLKELLFVRVLRGGELVYEGPLSGAPAPVQVAFAMDARYAGEQKAAAMWHGRAIQIPGEGLLVLPSLPPDGEVQYVAAWALLLPQRGDYIGDLVDNLLAGENGKGGGR